MIAIPYDLWASQGYLKTTSGPTISYEFVAHYLKNVFDRHRVQKIAFDRWGMPHLKGWLLNAGFSEQLIAEKFVAFGQGYQSMSPALRDLETIILEKKLRHGDHSASNAVIDATLRETKNFPRNGHLAGSTT